MTATRPYRPSLDHVARLLIFVGLTGLLAIASVFSQLDGPVGVWWFIAAFGLCWILGLIAQRFSTPVPLQTLPTPPGWPWLFFLIVLFPMVGRWIDLPWPWPWLLGILAAIVGGWAAYLPEHRRRAVDEQYLQRDQNDSTTPQR